MKRLIVLAFALLLNTQSFAHHPAPPPTPAPTTFVGSPWWLGLLMASGIPVFVLKHCKATKQC